MKPETLTRLITFWERLAPESVERLEEQYTEDTFFRDPFNEVRGIEDLKRVFHHMFETLHEPRFTILDTVEQGSSAFLVWDFDFRIKSLQPQRARRIHGTSHVRFAPDGRVSYHCDYWDAANELYADLPVLGWLMRSIARRMSASKSST